MKVSFKLKNEESEENEEKDPLFCIPSREHNSPQRFPPLFEQSAESAHRLVHRSGPTVGIAGAKGPRIVVVAEDDNFIRLTGDEGVRVPACERRRERETL
jgi:hypothetical protein